VSRLLLWALIGLVALGGLLLIAYAIARPAGAPGVARATGDDTPAAPVQRGEPSATMVTPLAGIEGPCDMFAFHEFGIPAVLWGPRGGSTHAADEYVEIDSVVHAAKALLLFVCEWCA
jgi:acetylornithine deacetylase/succinyl-diaminopimelate desuccinylase-like protein